MTLKSPYPYFGGKSKVADMVWSRFGKVDNYVEPFFGSGAVLLASPLNPLPTETINDLDGFVSNFWRALQAKPDEVAHHADWPVNENDLHARHAWLVGQKQSLQARLEGAPEFFDSRIAGWWVWGMACWIGGGFCDGSGPWQVREIDGVRQLVHLGDDGRGVNRKLAHLGDDGRGVNRKRGDLMDYMRALADRMRDVRVCCGDWSRVCGPSVTIKRGRTAVFLDPPYSESANRDTVYNVDSHTVANEVREWAIEWGNHKLMRIALCGYDGEHVMPEGWSCVAWKAQGGYESQSDDRTGNCKRERIWFSPNCERALQQEMFT